MKIDFGVRERSNCVHVCMVMSVGQHDEREIMQARRRECDGANTQ